MNERLLRVTFLCWLLFSIAALFWSDLVAFSALSRPSVDVSGNIVFRAKTPSGDEATAYPFTYAAAAVSLIGVTYYVYKAERRLWAIPLGLLAARAVTIGMINLYEQVFVAPYYEVWVRYYGRDLDTIMWTMSGLSWNLSTLPLAKGQPQAGPYLLLLLPRHNAAVTLRRPADRRESS